MDGSPSRGTKRLMWVGRHGHGMAVTDFEDLTKKVVKWSLAAFLATFFFLVLVLLLT